MMTRHLPPLKALRAFEAVVRLDGISNAALELNVTPGAVSRQIKTLEEWLGKELFVRRHRQIVPTTFAADYATALSQALDLIDSATRTVADTKESLTICSYPTFTQRWLVPRLKVFLDQNSGADIRFISSMDPRERLGTDYDAAICVGMNTTDWNGWHALRLLDIVTIPVCSPALLARHNGRIEVADLGNHTLLRTDPRPKDWPRWLASAGISSVDCDGGPQFENVAIAIQAAIEGIGILIVDQALVADDLASGRLVRPFDHTRLTDHSFYFVYSPARALQQRIGPVLKWITAQAEQAH